MQKYGSTRAAALLFTALLAGCGGGSSSPAPAPAPSTAQTISFPSIVAGTTNPAIKGLEESAGVKPDSKARSLIATATSALKVAFSSLTPTVCVVDIAVPNVKVVATGICRVAADQPGDATFAAAPRVVRSIFGGTPATLQPDDWKVVSATTGTPRFSPFDIGLKPQTPNDPGDRLETTVNYQTLINGDTVTLSATGLILSSNFVQLPVTVTQGTVVRCTISLSGLLFDFDNGGTLAQAIVGDYDGETPGDACTTKESGIFIMVKTGTTPPKVGRADVLYPASCKTSPRVNLSVDDKFALSDVVTPGAPSDGGTVLLVGSRKLRVETEDGTQILFDKSVTVTENNTLTDVMACAT
ncbi:MAG: hypothetical protein ABIP08_07350 [Lautropia sp.]